MSLTPPTGTRSSKRPPKKPNSGPPNKQAKKPSQEELNQELKTELNKLRKADPTALISLIQANADVDTSSRYDDTVLLYVKDSETVQKVVSETRNPTLQLISATKRQDLPIIKALLARKADINGQNSYDQTPAFVAAGWGRDLSVLRTLSRSNANFSGRDRGGMTTLMNAIQHNHCHGIVFLLGHNAGEIDDKNGSKGVFNHLPKLADAKTEAAKAKTKEIVRILTTHLFGVKASRDINALLYDAARSCEAWVLKVLIQAKSNPNDQSFPVLMNAFENNFNVIPSLLELKADLGQLNTSGATLLSRAATKCHIKTVKLCLTEGMNPNKGERLPLLQTIGARCLIVDQEGQERVKTFEAKRLDVMRLLLQYKANPNSYREKTRPLDLSTSTNNMAASRLLLEAKARVNQSNESDSQTPLLSLLNSDSSDIFGHMRLLLEYKADPTIQGREGPATLVAAQKHADNEVILKTLVAYKASLDDEHDSEPGLTARVILNQKEKD